MNIVTAIDVVFIVAGIIVGGRGNAVVPPGPTATPATTPGTGRLGFGVA
jgi:hypothetical protein